VPRFLTHGVKKWCHCLLKTASKQATRIDRNGDEQQDACSVKVPGDSCVVGRKMRQVER